MSEFIFNIILSLNNFINIYYFYSFIIYFILALIFFTFSLPGGLLISLSSGFFFGFIPGFIINICSASLGSLIFILFSKTILKKLFDKYYKKYSKKISDYIKNSSFEYLILIRLIIGPPLIFQNVCISMMNVSNLKILLSSIVGFSPLMLLFSYSGSYASNLIILKELTLSNIFSLEIIILLIIIISLTILRIFYKK